MNDKQYLEYCQGLWTDFSETLLTRTARLSPDHPLRELAEGFSAIATSSDDFYAAGRELVARLFDTYPEFAPTFPRQLLWFFGGDCLHYMAEDELTHFQQLDDLRQDAAARGELFNWQDARAKLLNLQ
jgi:hypothetical protein